jgi:hypothetical protein
MVKNTSGGKHKNQARKHLIPNTQQRLRTAMQEGEVYAISTKMLGNGQFYATILSSGKYRAKECTVVIRGKFRGRGKRGNIVNMGTVVLVGLREWTSEDRTDNFVCDLLEVYNDADKERLCSGGELTHADTNIVQWTGGFGSSSSSAASGAVDAGFHFATQEELDAVAFLDTLQSSSSSGGSHGSTFIGGDMFDDINVDDI